MKQANTVDVATEVSCYYIISWEVIVIQKHFSFCLFLLFRLGLNVAATHQNMSYRDSETTENLERHGKEEERGKRQEENSEN